MLGSPPRAPRIWLDPPPAHSKVEEQLLRRSISQLSCHQLLTEEKKQTKKEFFRYKPLSGWSEKGLKDGGFSQTTPRQIFKSKSSGALSPCQVQEVTTSSKTDIQGSTSGGIPVGIAIARQRVQQTNPTSPLAVQLTACQDRTPQPTPWPSTLAPSHHYHIRSPDQGMATAIQSPFQLVRDPVTGQLMLLPPTTPGLACLSLTEGSVQRTFWAGPPPLQVMHPHLQPQPVIVDRLVTLAAPSSQTEKRRNDCLSGVVQLPCDLSKSSPSTAQQGLLIHPTMSPHQAFSTLLVHNMPFATTTTNHQNSFLLSTQLTEQSLINQGGVVISNHLENTVINPSQIIGGCPESSFNPQAALLHHMSPSVVISSHTETNSFVRDLTPSVLTSLDNQVIVKSDMKSELLCMDQATSPPEMESKSEIIHEDIIEEDEENPTVVADAQNQTETPSNSEEEDTQGSSKLQSELVQKQIVDEVEKERETSSVVQQETTQIVTTQITRTTWTTEQTHHGTVQIEQQEEIKEVEEVLEHEQESQTSSSVDISGLELLSNTTIAQHENYHHSSPDSSKDSDAGNGDMGGLAVLCQAADFALSQPHFIPVASSTTHSSINSTSSTTSSSIRVVQESSLTTSARLSTLSVPVVTKIEMESKPESPPRRLSPPRLVPIHPVETSREVPLKDAFKVLRAKKVMDMKSILKSDEEDEEVTTGEPPVLEPWSAMPECILTPPLCPPTLTPNKKRSSDGPESSDDDGRSTLAVPPLKKRKFVKTVKENDEESSLSAVPIAGETAESCSSSKPKIRPKLKAEAKVKEPEDEMEEDTLEPSLHGLTVSDPSQDWRFHHNKPGKEKVKSVKKVKARGSSSPSKSAVSPKRLVSSVIVETTLSERQEPHLPHLPETRLTETDLKDVPLSIMMFSGGHFVPAQVTDIKAPGIYEVIYLRNPRNRRPQILCSEELLNSAIKEVRLDNLALPSGTRVCSYWSHEYNFMYTGIVSTPCKPEDKYVFVEFDDGDDSKINRDEIRLLPETLNLTDYDPEPSSPLMGRRRRTSDSKSTDQPKTPIIKVKPLPPLTGDNRDKITTPPEQSPSSESTHCETAGSEDVSETGSDTPPAIYIKNIVEDFLQTEKEKKEKRRLKKEKKRRLMEKGGGKVHKHKHKEGCHSHHKRKHKHHHQHRHKQSIGNSEMRIKESTVSKTGTESGSHKGPLVTTIAKPILSPKREEEDVKKEEDDDEEDEPEANSNNAVAKCSKFAAFLPPRHELWMWKGDGSKRGRGGGIKRGRKTFYKAIQRGSDVINVGDCAVFVSTGRPDRPFIGQVESFWGTQKNSMVVKVSWFYHPEETVGAPDVFPYPGALFKSPHMDCNDVQTISHRCEVVALNEFKARVDRKEVVTDTIYDNQEVYYLAGFYDPHDTSIRYESGVLIES